MIPNNLLNYVYFTNVVTYHVSFVNYLQLMISTSIKERSVKMDTTELKESVKMFHLTGNLLRGSSTQGLSSSNVKSFSIN